MLYIDFGSDRIIWAKHADGHITLKTPSTQIRPRFLTFYLTELLTLWQKKEKKKKYFSWMSFGKIQYWYA